MFKFSLPTISKLKGKITERLMILDKDRPMFFKVLTPEIISRAIKDIHTEFSIIQPMIVFKDSCYGILARYIGEELTPNILNNIIPKLATAVMYAKKGRVYADYHLRDLASEGCMLVKDINYSATSPKRLDITIQEVAGEAAGTIIRLNKSVGSAQRLIRECGLPKYDSYSPMMLGGLFFCAVLDFHGGQYVFRDIYLTSSVSSRNKEIYKQRKACVNNCNICHIGQDKCAISHHIRTYPIDTCKGDHPGPIVAKGTCLRCLKRGKVYVD